MFVIDDVVADIFKHIGGVLFQEIESERLLLINAEVEDFDMNDEAQAYCGFADTEICDGLEFRSYEIGFKSVLLKDLSAFKRMVCHELVHVMQNERGDEFDYDLPYPDQPHELEAYDLENWLLFEYNLKGKY